MFGSDSSSGERRFPVFKYRSEEKRTVPVPFPEKQFQADLPVI